VLIVTNGGLVVNSNGSSDSTLQAVETSLSLQAREQFGAMQ